MALSLTVNGVTYQYPQTGNENWGDPASNWAQAITNAYLPKAGGSFTLTGELDFGAFFGLRQLYLRSETTNPAAAGVVRLAKTDSVSWRNNANGADLALAINGSDLLTFGGTVVPVSGAIVNADINASAAIAYSKLALSGSILNADINASAAIAYSKLALTGSIVNADVNASAAIAYSKLALTGSILNADLAGSIAYSKLSLTGAILNADLAGSIAYSKLSLSGAILSTDLNATFLATLATLTGTQALSNKTLTASPISGSTGSFTKFSLPAGAAVALSGTQNNYSLPAQSFLLVDSSGGAVTFTGFAGGADGLAITVRNRGSNTIVFNDADTNSTAANRFVINLDTTGSRPSGLFLRLGAGGAATFIYDSVGSSWSLVSHTGTIGGTFTSNFSLGAGVSGANTSKTITYTISAGQVTLQFPDYTNMTCGTTTDTFSTAASTIPAALRPALDTYFFALGKVNNVAQNQPMRLIVGADGSMLISRVPDTTTNFTATQTNNGIFSAAFTYKVIGT